MKRLHEEVDLTGKMDNISITELRQHIGEILSAVELGKVFVIERDGKAVAGLMKLPCQNLTIVVNGKGNHIYKL